MPIQFFRADIGNAYVEVVKIMGLYFSDVMTAVKRML